MSTDPFVDHAAMFESFRGSGRHVADLSLETGDENLVGVPGRIYHRGLYIVRHDCGGTFPGTPCWSLPLENSEYVDESLRALEQRLFDWALAEGFIP